nr:uncharacterized mitochondrial protein AtMg00810-like [Tanacetum cinerariifolium]
MNYKPDIVRNQSNGNAGTKACDDAGKASMETVPGKDYILLPLWTADPLISQESKSSQYDGFQPSSDDGKKVDEDSRQESECKNQEKEDNMNSTNNMDVKSAFLYGKIKEEVYVCQAPGFEDPDFPNKVEKALYGLHQSLKAWFSEVKNASTPIKTQKPLIKYEDGEEVDVYKYRSMIGSLMYLTSSRPDIMFAVCACARYQVNPKVSHLHAVKRIFSLVAFLSKPTKSEGFEQSVDFLNANPIKYALMVNPTVYTSCIEQFWTTVKAKTVNGEVQLQALVDGNKMIITESTVRRDIQLEDAESVDCLPNAAIFEQLTLMGIYVTPSHTKKIFENMRRIGKEFSGRAINKEMYDSLERTANTATSLDAEQDRGNIFKTQSKVTPNESGSQGTNSGGGPRCQEAMGDAVAQTRVLDLETTKTTQEMEIESLKIRVKKLEKKQRSRTHKLKKLYKVGLSARVESSEDEGGEDVFVAQQDKNIVEKEVDVAQVQVTTAATTPTISIDEATLAQVLVELKRTKPKAKAKRIVFYEPEESTTTTTAAIPKPKSQDKGESSLLLRELKKREIDTKAQQRSIMSTYLKNIDGWKLKSLKKKSFAETQELFDKAMKKVNTFVDYRTELVEESSKKAEAEKINDDKDIAELKQLVKIIPDEEGVAIDAIPLAVKPPSIVN